jgi:sulfoxide reductase heme-binding subunit YedZ
MAPKSRHGFLAPAIITGWLLTLAQLVYRLTTHQLGANPIATALNQLGLLALVLLVACLSATPLKLTLGWTWPTRVRRTLGLLAFATAGLHFVLYLGPDQGFDLLGVLNDLGKRPFIAVGFLALVLLVPLAWTSSKQAVQRLTFPLWKRLHRLVYLVGMLAALHFFLRVKADHTQPLVYGFIILLGFAIRLIAWRTKLRSKRAAKRAPPTLIPSAD